MAYRKNLLTIDYHYDDDSGMYEIGEIDFGISAELENYIRRFGRKGVKDIIFNLSYLISEVFSTEEKVQFSTAEKGGYEK